MAATYYSPAERASAGRARPQVRALAKTLGVTIEEGLDGGWHEIRLLAPKGSCFDDLHELIIANACAMTDGLWERALEELRAHQHLIRPCAVADCEWCAEDAPDEKAS